MRQGSSLVTLGLADVARSRAFYERLAPEVEFGVGASSWVPFPRLRLAGDDSGGASTWVLFPALRAAGDASGALPALAVRRRGVASLPGGRAAR